MVTIILETKKMEEADIQGSALSWDVVVKMLKKQALLSHLHTVLIALIRFIMTDF